MAEDEAGHLRRPRLLCCGLATLDVVQHVDHVPTADEKVVARDLWVSAGGPAANAAVTAAALGVDARLVTRAGGSAVARLVVDDLRGHDVEVVDLADPDASPAVSTVLVTQGTGERAVVSVNATGGAAETVGPHPDWHGILAGVDALLVDGHHLDLALRAAHEARRTGVVVLLDGGSWKPGLEELLPLVDVAVLSAAFRLPDPRHTDPADAAALLAHVRHLGVPVVARSQGPGPIQLLTDDGVVEVPVPEVGVHDTLGAGDVLHGALGAWCAVRAGAGLPSVPAATEVAPGLAAAAQVASASCGAAGVRGWLAQAEHVAELGALVHRAGSVRPPA